MEPWVDLCEVALAKAFRFAGVPPPVALTDIAYATATFYLGVNLLSHLDAEHRIDALLARAPALAPLLATVAPAKWPDDEGPK